MKIKPVRTKKNYEAALKEIGSLFDASPGTREGDLLEVLATWP
jgi:HTH-type transcriptional regulator/antitoxin HigA